MTSPGLKKHTHDSDSLNSTVTANCNPVRAFYELPKGKLTSAQIVEESRNWLRSVSTCRPYTPKDKTRSLLNTSQMRTGYRPSSAFKVTAKSFDPFETTNKFNVQLEPVHTKNRNVQKQSKPARNETKKSKNVDERIGDYHSAASSQFSGSTEEYNLTESHKNSPRLELVGTQTRLISPIYAKRPVYSVIKSERHSSPKFLYNSCTGLQMISTTQNHLHNAQTKLKNTRNMASKVSSVLPEKYTSSNKITTKISYCHSPSQLSTLSSLDDIQSFRPNSPTDLLLLPNRTTALFTEEDKYQFRTNGIRSAVTATNTDVEFTRETVDENKPKSCGPHTKHQRSTSYNVAEVNIPGKFQASVSGDSGLSSGTELDQLIYRLNELSLTTSLSTSITKTTEPTPSYSKMRSSKTCDLQLLYKCNNEPIQLQYQQLNKKRNELTSSTTSMQQSVTEEEVDLPNLQVNRLHENDIIDLLNRIQNYISDTELEDNQNWSNRSTLLKTVFDLINYPSPRIHLTITRLMLTMNVTGRNLLNICKIVYKVAKNADNDCLFLEDPNTLDILIDALQLKELFKIPLSISSSIVCPSSPSSSRSSLSLTSLPYLIDYLFQNSTLFSIHLESLLFLTGTIKFLISNIHFMEKFNSNSNFLPNLLIIHKQLFEMLIYLWRKFYLVNSVKEFDHQIIDDVNSKEISRKSISKFIQHAHHVLVQVTEIFCHLSSMDLFRSQLIAENGILEHIINCLIKYNQFSHKMLNNNNNDITTLNITDNSNDQNEMIFNFTEFYTIYFNWIRFLSHLTEHTDVCHYLENCLAPINNQIHNNLSMNVELINSINNCVIVSTPFTELCNALTDFMYFFKERLEFVVRIAYVLGNLAAKCEHARIAIIPNENFSLKLCNLCRHYNAKYTYFQQSHHLMNGTNQNKLKTTEFNNNNLNLITDTIPEKMNNSVKSMYSLQYDVLVKLLRIIANASISETVGLICTTNFDCINLIIEIMENQSVGEPNELLLNCFASLNNLTYYIKQELTDESVAKQLEVAESLLRTVTKTNGHQDEFLGIIRVFGNLTRHTQIRQWLTVNGNELLPIKSLSSPYNIIAFNDIDNNSNNNDNNSEMNNLIQQNAFLYLLIQALNCSRPDIVYSTLGVLINMMTDVDQRPMLRILGGLSKLVEILREFAGYDWQLAGLTCKTLWNYTELADNSLREILDPEIMNEVLSLLTKFT
ncbi:Armadillo repeat-containing protein, partial [Schistosoma japonicum]